MFAGSFAPAGWMFCSGQSLAIAENETLFQLIGTTYGGDGQETFNLPDLQSRVPIHHGQGPGLSNYAMAEQGGVEQVTLNTNQIPIHNHAALGSTDTAQVSTPPTNEVPGTITAGFTQTAYGNDPPFHPLDTSSLQPVGGSQPHENLQPYGTLNYIISLYGIYPSPT
jgi:microcystin-dependent protein